MVAPKHTSIAVILGYVASTNSIGISISSSPIMPKIFDTKVFK